MLFFNSFIFKLMSAAQSLNLTLSSCTHSMTRATPKRQQGKDLELSEVKSHFPSLLLNTSIHYDGDVVSATLWG